MQACRRRLKNRRLPQHKENPYSRWRIREGCDSDPWVDLASSYRSRTERAGGSPRTACGASPKAWEEAGLERITPHACRHTFASLMIAAGVNAKALSTFMGHAKIGITLDRYGHLMPGSEEEAAGLLDAYLEAQREQAEVQARRATGERTGEQLANAN